MTNEDFNRKKNAEDLLKQFSESYNADSMGGELGLLGVRLSPAQFLGSASIEGAEQSLIEIYQNAVDELAEMYEFMKQNGILNEDTEKFIIEVIIDKYDNVIISDTGRGVPPDFNEKFGRPVVETVFEEINIGGKGKGYVEEGKSAYLTKTIGKHGSGAACANATADYFYVDSYVRKDGKHYRVEWEKAIKTKPMVEVGESEGKVGTVVSFKPSQEIFQLYNGKGEKQTRFYYTFDKFNSIFTEYAYAINNVVTKFRYQKDDGEWIEREYDSEKHIPAERVAEHADGKIYEGTIYDETEDYELNLVIGTNALKTRAEYLVSNMHRVLQGTHRMALHEVMKRWMLDIETRANEEAARRKMKRSVSIKLLEKRGITSPLAYCSCYIFIKMGNPQYSGQVKEELRVPHIIESLNQKFTELFETDLADFKEEVISTLTVRAVEELERMINEEKIKEQQAKRKEQKKEMEALVGTADKNKTRGMDTIEKDIITYARSERAEKTILFCVEGKTAREALNAVRDVNFHTIFSIDQRPTNVFIHDHDVLKHKPKYKMLFKTLYGTKDGNYKAVVIATDNDADGGLIKSYLIGFIYTYFPHYLTQGRVFIFDSPKFSAQKGEELKLFYSEEERDAFKATLTDNTEFNMWRFQQYKGLGSIPEEILSQLMNTGESFIRIAPDSIEEGMSTMIPFLSDKQYKKRLVMEKYADESMLYHNITRREIIKQQEVEFDVNELDTQYSTVPDLTDVTRFTPMEGIINSYKAKPTDAEGDSLDAMIDSDLLEDEDIEVGDEDNLL